MIYCMVSLHPFKIIGVSPQLDLLKRLDKRLVSRLNACMICLPPPSSVAEVCEVRIVLYCNVLYVFSRLIYQHLCRFIHQSLHDMFLPTSPECSMVDSEGEALLREFVWCTKYSSGINDRTVSTRYGAVREESRVSAFIMPFL
jgi:hypothetical protein